MKAKITMLDPTGAEHESEEFDIPLIPEYDPEAMKTYRGLLKIGKYEYYIAGNGVIVDVVSQTPSILKLLYKCNVAFLDGKTIKNRYGKPDVDINKVTHDHDYHNCEVIEWNENVKILHLKTKI